MAIGVETVICEFCAKKNRQLELLNFFEFHQSFHVHFVHCMFATNIELLLLFGPQPQLAITFY